MYAAYVSELVVDRWLLLHAGDTWADIEGVSL